MRALPAPTALALTLVMLAGCQSEAAQRNQIRDGGIRSCVEGFQRSAGSQNLAGRVDPERVCACTIDRIMDGRSVEDLRRVGEAQPTPQERAQAQQCMLEALGSADGGNAAASAP